MARGRNLFIVYVAGRDTRMYTYAAAKTSRTDVKRPALNYIAFPWRIDEGRGAYAYLSFVRRDAPKRCTGCTLVKLSQRNTMAYHDVRNGARSSQPQPAPAGRPEFRQGPETEGENYSFSYERAAAVRICIWQFGAIRPSRGDVSFTYLGFETSGGRPGVPRNSHAPCR